MQGVVCCGHEPGRLPVIAHPAVHCPREWEASNSTPRQGLGHSAGCGGDEVTHNAITVGIPCPVEVPCADDGVVTHRDAEINIWPT